MALVSMPIGTCPSCGVGQYGGVLVRDDSVVYGCTQCDFTKTHQLPTLRKQIVYVDQLVLSLASKFKKTGRGEKKWLELYYGLGNLSRKQLIVCPLSQYHRHEAELSSSHWSSIIEFGRLLSQGTTMRSDLEVEARQLWRSLRRYLGGQPPEPAWDELDPRDAFPRNPHAWTDYTSLWVESAPDPKDVARRRKGKEEAHRVMQQVSRDWVSRPRVSFDEVFREELDCIGPTLWLQATAYFKKHASLVNEQERIEHYWQAGHSVLLTERLTAAIRQQFPDRNALVTVANFYHSEHFKQTPYVILQARLFAGMASHVKGGRAPRASDSYDVLTISRYAPYCDAMFVDDFMRSLAGTTPVSLEELCGVGFFSAKTLDAFIGYLDGLETSMPRSHQIALDLAYPRPQAMTD